MTNSPRIGDYALIGNCRSAALVSKFGSIDWCCLPEFHSPSIFSAMLDRERGGYFSIAPERAFTSSQAYIENTNVVETVFTTNEGTVKLIDAFVANTEKDKRRSLFPDHEILRIVRCTSGTLQMQLEYCPTTYYGRKKAALTDNKKLGIKFSWKENNFILLTTLPEGKMQFDKNKVAASFIVEEGESVLFSFSCTCQSPAVLPELKVTGWERMKQTIDFWSNWVKVCTYNGPYKKQVLRSALALKLLGHAPSGAIIAAPTTSLPEERGGERNWDYRYCWLRDASFTVRALIKLGFDKEAHAYMNWILHATQLTRPKLHVLYSIWGQPKLKEENLDWLKGFENSKPVRIGNDAHSQFQLDVYGEVLDAFFSYSSIIPDFDRSSRNFMLGLGEVICKCWDEPDQGIWEVRSVAAHHTHSKVMAWVGLDRLIKLCNKYKWKNVPVEKFEKVKKEIEQEIELRGFNTEIGSYTRSFGEDAVDASSLVFSLVGYCSPTSPAMLSTVQNITRKLSKNNLIYRYLSNDGIPGGEGAFGICNFWLAENFAKAGRIDDAISVFDSILKASGDAGLLSEEIDPSTYELLGNYPQGFTHIGLVNAALTIEESSKKGNKAT